MSFNFQWKPQKVAWATILGILDELSHLHNWPLHEANWIPTVPYLPTLRKHNESVIIPGYACGLHHRRYITLSLCAV